MDPAAMIHDAHQDRCEAAAYRRFIKEASAIKPANRMMRCKIMS